MSSPELPTTSYAILGLLGIKSWTTYELAQQMQRSMKHFWPRAASRVYEEPKRLAALGLAKAERETVGRRPRTLYSITPNGRRTLSAWLATPGTGPVIELEALLKVFFAEQARTADVAANVAAIQEWAAQQNAENVMFARLYRDGGGQFPQRLVSIALTGKFMTDVADAIGRWAQWAAGVVAEWPEEAADATPPWDVFDEIGGRRLPGEER